MPRHMWRKGGVVELGTRRHTAEQKAAATHVTPTHEAAREMEPFAKGAHEHVDVLPGRDASEEDDARVRGERA